MPRRKEKFGKLTYVDGHSLTLTKTQREKLEVNASLFDFTSTCWVPGSMSWVWTLNTHLKRIVLSSRSFLW